MKNVIIVKIQKTPSSVVTDIDRNDLVFIINFSKNTFINMFYILDVNNPNETKLKCSPG